ncbi:MAG: hypothetical protein PIR02_06145 [Microbacterium enclense]
MRRTTKTLALTVSALALLTACTSAADPAPQGTETVAAPASPTPTGGTVVASPRECDDVDLIADATVTGDDLAACVIAFSRAEGSGHLHLQSADLTGEADFVYGDAPATSGSVTGPEGTNDFVLTPTEAWVTFDGAWVKADASSDDYRAVIASTIGQSYRAFADPSAAASLLSSSPSWTVQTGQDTVALPDGTDVRAWRLQADAPFSAGGVEITEMIVWLGEGHRVVGTQATGTFGGVQATSLQQFTAWGEPVDIEVPKG